MSSSAADCSGSAAAGCAGSAGLAAAGVAGVAAPAVPDDTPIDLVFVDFIETQLLGILNTVQTAKTFTTADVASYTPILASEVLGLYAQEAWN